MKCSLSMLPRLYHFPKRIGGLPERPPMRMCMEGSSCEGLSAEPDGSFNLEKVQKQIEASLGGK